MTNGRSLRFAVIGAGMAGVLSAIKLEEAGHTDFTVYEKGGSVGGTWRENTYPGLSCDVPSHLYSYSFEPSPEWSHRFSPGPEIQAYFERVAATRGVLPRIRFNEEVVAATYDDGTKRWRLETARGNTDEVDVVIAATGVLHQPHYPDIEGLDSFEGACFHSARWDHDVKIDGARVGVIGTGSTATQIVGAIVDRVSSLTLFQRTAQWIMPQDNPAYTGEEIARFRADPSQMAERRDHYSKMFDVFANGLVDASSEQVKLIEQACLANLEANVVDAELREKLRPTYRAACKRLVASSNFYDAIQQPNAELVIEKIDRVEPRGVRTVDGELHELDVLVLATGFHADAFMQPMAVTGRGSASLADVWTPRPKAYLSLTIPDFPNLFMLNGPNGPVGNFSLIGVAELQIAYVLQLVELLGDGRCREISASTEALERFEVERAEAATNTVWATGCRSWYLDDRGLPAVWPWTLDRFRDQMQAPNLDDYDLR